MKKLTTKDDLMIQDRKIGNEEPCFIIAEAGVNHNGQVGNALKLVDVAAEAGADAVKFQIYDVAEQISSVAKTAAYQKNTTGMSNMKEMAYAYELPWKAHREILEHCKKRNIIYISSCFDANAVDFVLGMGVRTVKIASGEITNFPLLAYSGAKADSIILSTGMSTIEDVRRAINHIRKNGHGNVALFHCVSSYPAALEDVNLKVIESMKREFDVPVGFSDHTEGNLASIAAVALGADLIEKHFTLDKSLPGPDHAMSLNPFELKEFIESIRQAELALGDGCKKITEKEQKMSVIARRSLCALREIAMGEALDNTNVTLKRPATGIDPREWKKVEGCKAAKDIKADIPITWDMVK